MSQIILLAGAGFFIYSLLYKPDWAAILLFSTIIADINFDLPGMPLNFRAAVTLSIFAKVLYDAKKVPGASFLSTWYSKYMIVFVLYLLAVTYQNGLLEAGVVKEFVLALFSAYLAYYFYMKHGSYKIFKTSIILAGFCCVGDLAYTYMKGGGLWIQRIYFDLTGSFAIVNHNFFGYICGVAFVFLLADYLTENSNNKHNLILMPVMFMGVLLSTSRSSLLMLIIIALVLIIKGLLSSKNSKKAYKLVVVTVGCLVLALCLFSILTSVFHVNSEFMEQISARLIDEPMAVVNRALGNDFKAESLDSMDWRAEATAIAYNTYMNILESSEQMFGIGYEGFMARHYGYDGIYDAHNGILLMFIEFGAVGALIYFAMLTTFIGKFWSLKIFSPMMVCLLFIILFITSHNRELISLFMFILTATMAAELEYFYIRDTEVVADEDELSEISNESLET